MISKDHLMQLTICPQCLGFLLGVSVKWTAPWGLSVRGSTALDRFKHTEPAVKVEVCTKVGMGEREPSIDAETIMTLACKFRAREWIIKVFVWHVHFTTVTKIILCAPRNHHSFPRVLSEELYVKGHGFIFINKILKETLGLLNVKFWKHII